MKKKKTELKSEIIECKIKWEHRLMIGTPTTGLIRMEWAMARYGQLMPTNWSHVDMLEYMHTIAPLRYSVADAQNVIVKRAIDREVEWLLLIEHDNVLPSGALVMFNDYMIKHSAPVISGLYFTKADPPEPMIYRTLGDGYFNDWVMGDKIWCTGVPTGTLFLHMSVVRSVWNESEEYEYNGEILRKVFEQPAKLIYNPDKAELMVASGTSDLAFCDRIIKEKHLEKAGWPEIAKKKYPFLVDTNIFVQHIDQNGRMFPIDIPKQFKPEDWDKKKRKDFIHVGDTRIR